MARDAQEKLKIDTPTAAVRGILLVALFTSFYGPYLAVPLPIDQDFSLFRLLHLLVIPFLLLPRWEIKVAKNAYFYLMAAFLGFFLYAAVTILWAESLGKAVEYFSYLLVGYFLALTPVVFGNRSVITWLVFSMVIFAGLNIMLAPIEIFFDKHLPYAPPYLPNMPYGFFFNPNQLGHTLVMIAPFIIFLPIWINRSLSMQFAAGGTFVMTVMVMLTGSRGSIAGLFLVFTLAAIIYRKRIMEHAPALSLMALAVIVPLAILMVTDPGNQRAFQEFLPNWIKLKTERVLLASEEGKADSSLSYRGELLKLAGDSLREAPLGRGPGGAESFIMKRMSMQGESANPHNPWGEVALSYGVAGLLLWSFFFFGILYAMLRHYRTSENEWSRFLAISCAGSLLAFIPASVSHGTVWRSFPAMWVVFGIALYLLKEGKTEKGYFEAKEFLKRKAYSSI